MTEERFKPPPMRRPAMTTETEDRIEQLDLDQGEAAIKVELVEGQLRVIHGHTNELLMEGTVEDGFWVGLWEYIHTNTDIAFRAQA